MKYQALFSLKNNENVFMKSMVSAGMVTGIEGLI